MSLPLQNMKISGVVMFKNEAPFFLVESVKSFLRLCDEVIAIDTGSNDGGSKVLSDLHDPRIKIVYYHQDSTTNKEYGNIKNWAMQYCKGDYIWSFDADEVLGDNYTDVRQQLLDHPDVECWDVEGRHYFWHLNKVDAQVPNHWWLQRLFKNKSSIKYPTGKAHGLPTGFVSKARLQGVFIHHYGYVKNACFDLWRYRMNYEAPEMHSFDFLNEWLRLRLTGTLLVGEVPLSEHPQIIKDKFHFDRWAQ